MAGGTPAREKPALDFASKEEFRAVCRYLAMRMHHLNRVAMGEAKFAWHVAEALDGLGRAFEQHYGDEETARAFGNGWEAGTLSREEARARLFEMIREGR